MYILHLETEKYFLDIGVKANKGPLPSKSFYLIEGARRVALGCSFPSAYRTNTGLEVQLPQLDYLMKDKESVLICARSSFAHLVDEALFLGLQLPILVVQNLRSCGPGVMGRWICDDFPPGGWKVGCSSSVAPLGDMLDADWIQKQLECLCGTFDGWRPEAAPQLPCSRAVARHPTITRIPAGAEMLTANRCDGGGMCPLSHLADESRIWHLSYHFETGLVETWA